MGQIIAVAGLAGAGKDTFASCLQNIMSDDLHVATRFAFADPLKEIVNTYFGWDDRHSHGCLKEIILCASVPFCKTGKLSQIILHNTPRSIVSEADAVAMERKFNVVMREKCSEMSMMMYTSQRQTHYVLSPREAYQWFGTEVAQAVNKTIWTEIALDIAKSCDYLIIPDLRFKHEHEAVLAAGGKVVFIDRDVKQMGHSSEAYAETIKNHPETFVVDNNQHSHYLLYGKAKLYWQRELNGEKEKV